MDLIGQVVGKYRIESLIGRGGMGEVYAATDTVLHRAIALKLIAQVDAGEVQARERFLREARAVARLEHPNIVRVYDAGQIGDVPFIAMEYLEGTSGRELLRSEVPLSLRLELIAQVCDGLGYAHQKGVVHRDIKPGNIIIVGNRIAKIIDFGLARLHDDRRDLTQGQIIGSGAYMSPEQLDDPGSVGAQSDLFSVGSVLYEIVSGRAPFTGASLAETILNIVRNPPPFVDELSRSNPPELLELIVRCLAKQPQDRPRSAEEIATWLRRVGAARPSAETAFRMPPNRSTSEDRTFQLANLVLETPRGPVASELERDPTWPVAPEDLPTGSKANRLLADALISAPEPVPPPNSPGLAASGDASPYVLLAEEEPAPEWADPIDGGRSAESRPPPGSVSTLILVSGITGLLIVAALVGWRYFRRPDDPRTSTSLAVPEPLSEVSGGRNGAPKTEETPVAPTNAPRFVTSSPAGQQLAVALNTSTEFRVEAAGALDALPRWFLNDEPVAKGDRYLYRAERAGVRDFISVSYGDADATPVVRIWYVNVTR